MAERGPHPLLDGVADLLYPARCAICDLPGDVLCHSCEEGLDLIDQQLACPWCGVPFGSELCTECQGEGSFAFSGARAAGSFDDDFSHIIVCYKDAGERRLAPVCARLMARCTGPDWRTWADAVTFVPSSAQAYRRRGFDHMEGVAREYARLIHRPLVDVLVKSSVKDQRELTREQRAANIASAFRIGDTDLAGGLIGRHVILIDDVFTTGATLDACATTLLGAGVGEVRVVVLARVW